MSGMILLDKSSCDLLRYLIQLEAPETIMTISRETEQSRRKIYYHLEKINDALPQGVAPIVSKPRIGILLDDEQKAVCQTLLTSIGSYSYVMSIDERIQLMIIYIAISPERVTIERLIELTDVSRNTVLNDLNDIRYQFKQEQYKVNLYATKSQGYFLKCHPLNKIQYLHSFLYDIFHEASSGFLNVLQEKVTQFMGDERLLSADVQAFLIEEIEHLEAHLGKKINRSEATVMLRILPYLLLAYHNTEMTEEMWQELELEFQPLTPYLEYKIAQRVTQSLAELGSLVDERDIYLIALLLLSYRKDHDSHLSSQNFASMKEVIDEAINRFELVSQTSIENKEDLSHRLLMHSKALLFRKSYGILSKNPLTVHVKAKYPRLFSEVSQVALYLEEAWQIDLNDDDLAYLTIHFGGSLRSEQKDNLKSLKHIYIVCDDGIAVQKLLMKQCQKYLPEKSIQAIFTTEQFKSVEDLLVADLLISTSDVLESPFPIIQVNPILSHEDIIKLSHFIQHEALETLSDSFEERLKHLLVPHVKEEVDVAWLSRQVHQLLVDELMTLSTGR